MKIRKKILPSFIVQKLVALLGAAYLKIVSLTSRWDSVGQDIAHAYPGNGKNAIYVCWHGRMLILPLAFPHRHHVAAIASDHRDGKLIAYMLQFFGTHILWGSTDRQGSRVLRAGLQHLKAGHTLVLTPDGPRGPRMRINSNVIALARMANVPIIPVAFATRKAYIHHGWDKFVIPKCRDHGIVMYGHPLHIPQDKDLYDAEQYKILLEDQLNQLTQQADLSVGKPLILPEQEQTRLKIKEQS